MTCGSFGSSAWTDSADMRPKLHPGSDAGRLAQAACRRGPWLSGRVTHCGTATEAISRRQGWDGNCIVICVTNVGHRQHPPPGALDAWVPYPPAREGVMAEPSGRVVGGGLVRLGAVLR